MTKIALLLISFCISCSIAAQNYSTFYYQRVSLFEKLPTSNEDVLFLGNSISNGGEWAELFNDINIKNRGISGDVTMGVYDRLNSIIAGKPNKIFLLIGINDLARGIPSDTIENTIDKIIYKIQNESPQTDIYLQSILPVNDSFGMFEGHTKYQNIIDSLNEKLNQLACKRKIRFIDLYSFFVIPGTDKLNPEFTNDGLHLLGAGYLKWAELVKPYIYE